MPARPQSIKTQWAIAAGLLATLLAVFEPQQLPAQVRKTPPPLQLVAEARGMLGATLWLSNGLFLTRTMDITKEQKKLAADVVVSTDDQRVVVFYALHNAPTAQGLVFLETLAKNMQPGKMPKDADQNAVILCGWREDLGWKSIPIKARDAEINAFVTSFLSPAPRPLGNNAEPKRMPETQPISRPSPFSKDKPWPFKAPIPNGFRFVGTLANGSDEGNRTVWVLQGQELLGITDTILVVRPPKSLLDGVWAAELAVGLETGSTTTGKGWVKLGGTVEGRAGWTVPQLVLGTKARPGDVPSFTFSDTTGHADLTVPMFATEASFERPLSFSVVGASRATAEEYKTIGNNVNNLAKALKGEISSSSSMPRGKQPFSSPTSRPTAASGPAVDREKQAAQKVEQARLYISNGIRGKGRQLLEEVANDFSNTQAAEKAKKELEDLGKEEGDPSK